MQKQEINKIFSNQILIDELYELIEKSKKLVFSQTNSSLTMLFWNIGKRINKEILRNKRAEYSKQVVSILSLKLTSVYGRNFKEKNLRRMLQFATQFKDKAIVVTLSRQLSWSHFLILIPLKSIEEKN